MARVGRRVRIPIHGGVDSLNVGAAAAIACYVLGPGPAMTGGPSAMLRRRQERRRRARGVGRRDGRSPTAAGPGAATRPATRAVRRPLAAGSVVLPPRLGRRGRLGLARLGRGNPIGRSLASCVRRAACRLWWRRSTWPARDRRAGRRPRRSPASWSPRRGTWWAGPETAPSSATWPAGSRARSATAAAGPARRRAGRRSAPRRLALARAGQRRGRPGPARP